MRTFGSGFTSKLASSSYLPVVFCKYELITYVSGATAGTGTQTTTNYYWSERGITYASQDYEARLINTSPLEQTLDESNQVMGEMGLQIANHPSNLAGAIQAGMKCTVYLGFEDTAGSGTVTDAEIIYIGIVEGDIEITEDSVSFNLQDIANIYDKQLPELITREEYPYADPDSIGDTKPIIMGRNRDVECRAVASGFASVLGTDSYGRLYDDTVYKVGLPPIISVEGDTEIYVTDDIGWWKDSLGMFGMYPEMTINTTTLTDIYDSPIDGTCNIPGSCTNTDYSHNISLCETVHGETYTQFNTEALCTAGGGTWYSSDETVQPTDVVFDTSLNLWKITLQEPLKTDHFMGDTVYESGSLCATINQGYAYLVADHAVESITNVKVDGLPVTAQVITDHQTPLTCSDWNLPTGKAYVIVPTNAGGIGKSGSGGLSISDTTDVSDTIDVDDTINVDENGHKHDTGSANTYNYSLDLSWRTLNSRITIKSGGFSMTVLDLNAGIFVPSPINFTSSSEQVIIDTTDSFSYLTIKGQRTDNLGNTSYVVKSLGSGNHGGINVPFPAGIGGSPTSEVDAGVYKTGDASKSGAAVKVGLVKLVGGNSAADVLVGQKVTCDVIGICDGSTGYVTPHNQIKKLINLYARNPLVGTEGAADIVEFVNESEMDTAFDKVFNTDNASKSGATLYPLANTKATSSLNPSPTADLSNTDMTEGFHALDFALTEPNRLRDIVGDMLFHSNSTINWQNGIAQIRYTGDTPTNDDDIKSDDIVMKTMSLARSKASDLATDVVVRYDYSPVKSFARRYDYAEKIGTGDFYTKTKLDAIRARGTYSRERSYDLPMAKDQITAEFVSKRLYDKHSSPKFESGISTVLKNLSIEVGDYVTVETPIYVNGVLDKGLVVSKTLEFGSAVDKSPDLIHLSVRENHTGSGFYLQTDDLTDSLSISDSAPVIALNDVNTKFQSLSDSLSITESIDVQPVQRLTDSLSIAESLVFGYEVSLTDTLTITDVALRFTGILFWDVSLTDSFTITDGTPVITFPELVTTEAGEWILTEAGDYLEVE